VVLKCNVVSLHLFPFFFFFLFDLEEAEVEEEGLPGAAGWDFEALVRSRDVSTFPAPWLPLRASCITYENG